MSSRRLRGEWCARVRGVVGACVLFEQSEIERRVVCVRGGLWGVVWQAAGGWRGKVGRAGRQVRGRLVLLVLLSLMRAPPPPTPTPPRRWELQWEARMAAAGGGGGGGMGDHLPHAVYLGEQLNVRHCLCPRCGRVNFKLGARAWVYVGGWAGG